MGIDSDNGSEPDTPAPATDTSGGSASEGRLEDSGRSGDRLVEDDGWPEDHGLDPSEERADARNAFEAQDGLLEPARVSDPQEVLDRFPAPDVPRAVVTDMEIPPPPEIPGPPGTDHPREPIPDMNLERMEQALGTGEFPEGPDHAGEPGTESSSAPQEEEERRTTASEVMSGVTTETFVGYDPTSPFGAVEVEAHEGQPDPTSTAPADTGPVDPVTGPLAAFGFFIDASRSKRSHGSG